MIMTKFAELGLDPKLVTSVSEAGYDTPTPIQTQAIPLVLSGRDVMGLAQTGTGKTAAFGLPLIHQLLRNHDKRQPKSIKALVLAPTRELVNQIAVNLRDYVKGTHLKVMTVVGGVSINRQIEQLNRGTDILVATPGRLIDLMDRRAIRLDTATFLVLDEADQMLDMGFIHALRRIAPELGTPRQTMLFSATMPKQMEELSRAYLTDPAKVQVTPPGKAADKITQCVYYAQDKEDKARLLIKHLRGEPDGLSLVFSRTKHGAERLMKKLVAEGFKAVSIHGNKSQGQRDRALAAFRAGEARVLVATDVAARGIDIPGVSHVFNFDLPEVADNYVHRIGRTARAGADGDAISFVSGVELGLLRDIEKLMKISIPVLGGERPQEEKRPTRQGRGGGGGRGRSGGGHRGQGGNQSGGKPSGGKSDQRRSAGGKSRSGVPSGGRPGGSRRRKKAS
ncbi:ATP-dependent RNA helicase RhlE [Aliiroseovarius sp. xm-m-379]|nr:ATP-dependent RNA helicase RhlE [Aliiroseovarius sp. xm-d-517]NRP25542.1 ATP-dependent RNA helicase RhlE [Aliiroseovarius sp. xm-m-379]NRP29534.1 ATP-dependent RNA helicase RhlE [Aliiroseovarius sp. xm-m-314]NRP34341.1 ATP-dependent RNA helicase RhlE [Aliiroseovarius sp. xm-a-104]NRP41700.1 ATP-dependent RNA helicase RhlE [Aliiroseovarius sp. xm-m-339-2]NRP44273.1 ATP-dependent RNA helicase RhlE [Aliiroseovarius sp. xm-m-378]NRP48352.1 ATP-dependent RNA helicase RhlE [Aliiroseovarius sp. x